MYQLDKEEGSSEFTAAIVPASLSPSRTGLAVQQNVREKLCVDCNRKTFSGLLE